MKLNTKNPLNEFGINDIHNESANMYHIISVNNWYFGHSRSQKIEKKQILLRCLEFFCSIWTSVIEKDKFLHKTTGIKKKSELKKWEQNALLKSLLPSTVRMVEFSCAILWHKICIIYINYNSLHELSAHKLFAAHLWGSHFEQLRLNPKSMGIFMRAYGSRMTKTNAECVNKHVSGVAIIGKITERKRNLRLSFKSVFRHLPIVLRFY